MYSGEAAGQTAAIFEQSQDGLYTLAADTGGKAWMNNNDLSLGIVQAQRACSSYYLIGYYTSNPEPDGKFRRIAISVKDRAEAKLEYGAGYYGDKVFAKLSSSDKERQLEEAFALENPITDIPLALAVYYFQLNADEYYVPVVVNIAGAELVSQRGGAGPRAVLDLIGEIKDRNGQTLKTLRDRVNPRLDGAEAAKLEAGVVEYDTGFTLLPGEYVIKLLVRDGGTGRIGTHIERFVVPDLNKAGGRMRVSSVILGGQRIKLSEALHTVGKDKRQLTNPLVRDGRKLVPSVTRVFDAREPLLVYLQTYQSEQPLTAYVGLYRSGAKVFEAPAAEFKAAQGKGWKITPVQFALAVDGLEAGRYACQVTVIDRTTGQTFFWRAPVLLSR
jgi:hypothetical protein